MSCPTCHKQIKHQGKCPVQRKRDEAEKIQRYAIKQQQFEAAMRYHEDLQTRFDLIREQLRNEHPVAVEYIESLEDNMCWRE